MGFKSRGRLKYVEVFLNEVRDLRKGLEGKPDLGVDVKPILYVWLQNTLYVKPPLSSFRDDENSYYEYFFGGNLLYL